jgi:mycothiol S-conjugate amidase
VGIFGGVDTPVDRTGAPLSLLTVHAHPDDEASKGSATVARYSDEGVRTSLVCCTGGEAGDILNPAVDTPEARADLFRVRMQELENAAAAIGYAAVHLLGYHDSGMPDSDHNARPDNFANAPIEEAVERLVGIIRLERPQVIVTYADDRKFYPHPDHIRVHEISLPAFEAAGDPRAFPDAGPAWQPLKLYYTGFSRRRVQALHDEHVRRGEESPYAQWFERELPDHAERFTTFVDVGDWLHRRRAALLAHRTQVDPEGFWMRLPDDAIRRVFPWDEYLLARSLVDTGVAEGDTEDDLFTGVRAVTLAPRP